MRATLHDSTGQNLVAATLIAGRIENLLPETARSAFGQLETILQQSIREVRTVSYLLHPPLLDEAGLALALRHFVDGFMVRSGIAVDLDISPDADSSLSLIRNWSCSVSCRRRSPMSFGIPRAGRRACVSLASPPARREEIVLTVEDAGDGKSKVSGVRRLISRKGYPNSGVGLASMRERLAQIGGRLEVRSGVGGTKVEAVVPTGQAN